MRRIPTLATALAVGALLPLSTVAGAAPAAVTAAGAATSSASIVKVSAAGHTVVVGDLRAFAETVHPADAAVNFIPVTLDGAHVVPPIAVTPATGTKSVGGTSTSPGLSSILSATSPSATIKAVVDEAGPVASVLSGLGSASLLGMPIGLNGTLNVASAVTKDQAGAGKGLTVSDISLPSLADLLAALGIDLGKLPAPVLNDLLGELPLDTSAVDGAIATANGVIDTAQAAVDSAEATLAPLQDALDTATANAAAAQGALDTVQDAFDAMLATNALTQAAWDLLGPIGQAAIPGGPAALANLTAANGALATANTLVNTAQGALVAPQALLDTALDALLAAIGPLADIVNGVLDGNPLVSIGSAAVQTSAIAKKAGSADITGTVSGIEVLGMDLLDSILGSSTLDLVGSATSALSQVNAQLASIGSTLSSVLGGATGLSIPAPVIKVLDKSTSTGMNGGFSVADADVSVLSISLPAIALPSIFALDSLIAGTPLAGMSLAPGNATGFISAPFSVEVGSLSENATFRPASTTSTPVDGTPDGSPTLPNTGGPAGLAVMALLVTGVALIGRRYLVHAEK